MGINEQVQYRMEVLISRMKAAENVTEELNETNQMAWIQKMNSIQTCAEEIVMTEIINQ